MKKYHIIIFILLLLPSNKTLGDVYKCQSKGVIEYSQFPCSPTAQKIKIKINNSNSTNTTKPKNKQSISLYLEIKKLKRLINKSQKKITTYQRKVIAETNLLKYKTTRTRNNLAGATLDGALATQMEGVAKKYGILIDNEQKQIDRLLKQKDRLLEQKKSTASSSKNLSNKIYSNTTPSKETIKNSIQNNKIKLRIMKAKSLIASYKTKMEQEVEKLKDVNSNTTNNLAGATKSNSISNEMNAVIKKYDTLISIKQRELDHLYNTQENIN